MVDAGGAQLTTERICCCTVTAGSIVVNVIFNQGVAESIANTVVAAYQSFNVSVTLSGGVTVDVISARASTIIGGTHSPTTGTTSASTTTIFAAGDGGSSDDDGELTATVLALIVAIVVLTSLLLMALVYYATNIA